MTRTTRQPIRPCGHRYATKDEALRSKRVLAGTHEVIPCNYGCGGWHLEAVARKALTPTRATAAARDTGPDARTRALVLARDGYQCARCGRPCGPGIGQYSLQHRVPRGSGGTSSPGANSPVRLLLLCGTATTLCHGEVESHKDPEDSAKGYRLESWQDPAQEPVMYFDLSGGGFTAWLLPDGSLSFDGPGRAA